MEGEDDKSALGEGEEGSVAEDENNAWRISPPPEERSRKKISSEYINRTWSRKCSPTRGDYLKIDDEMMQINRGGQRISIVKSTAHNVPTITIGHLDQNGKDTLDTMLKGNYTVDEIIEYFKNYVNSNDGQRRSFRTNRSRNPSVDPETEAEQTVIKNVNDSLKTVPRQRKNAGQDTKNHLNVPKNIDVSKPKKIDVSKPKSGNEASEHQQKPPEKITKAELVNGDQEKENIEFVGKNENDTNGDYEVKTNKDKDTKKTTGEKATTLSRDNLKKATGKTKSRNVFDILDADYLKRTIPYMHPNSKQHTFQFFEDRVHDVVDGKGLVEEDVLDVMQFRMGGSYLSEIKQLREQKWDLDYVETYFLQKDFEMEKEIRKKKELIEKSKTIDKSVEMRRVAIKDLWGVNISYTKSSESGLVLILVNVTKDSPAWMCGLRDGDAIVTVNEWQITLMERPEVALHLFQASANMVKLGILSNNGFNDGCRIRSIGIF